MRTLTHTALLICLSFFTINASAIAANAVSPLALANQADYDFVLTSVDKNQGSCRDSCYPQLSKAIAGQANAQQWVDLGSSTAWIDLEYDVCQRVDYTDDGSAVCAGYLGHFGITFTPTLTRISNSDGGSVNMQNDSRHNIFAINFAPDNPPAPITIAQPAQYATAPLRGTNIAGAEFASGSGNIDWIINAAFPNQTDLAYFSQYGMNTYRLPIRWSYLQPHMNGEFNAAYLAEIKKSAKLYLNKGFNVIIDLHDYMHFETNPANEPLHSSRLVSSEELTQIWDKLTDELKDLAADYPNGNHTNQLIFDLMNEPTDDITSLAVLNRYNAVIKTLRAKGVTNLILLEGANYSGMHSWTTQQDSTGKTNADVFTAVNIADPINNVAVNVHQYFDYNNSGSHSQCVALPTQKIINFMQWAQAQKLKYMVTEFGSADNANCRAVMREFLHLIHTQAVDVADDAGGLLGWTTWAGGRYWGPYLLSQYLGGGASELPAWFVQEGWLSQNPH